jgi:hypothetical protein
VEKTVAAHRAELWPARPDGDRAPAAPDEQSANAVAVRETKPTDGV